MTRPDPKNFSQAGGRATYRHGDLRRTLIDAGVELARGGGPEAVVLREATRQAGVVPNAAYRHFSNRDDLLAAVRASALASLAQAIEQEMAAGDAAAAPDVRAKQALRAVGIAYLRFATAEPGLFRTAFSVPRPEGGVPDPDMAGTGPNPFLLLGTALDQMVTADLLPEERRPGAEFLAWSAVHGLATLLIDGPLAAMAPRERDAIGERLVAMVEKGL